jgi:hypothetical protein
MAGKKRTSFMKLARDRELAEKRVRKQEKRAARRAGADADADAARPPEAGEPPAGADDTKR